MIVGVQRFVAWLLFGRSAYRTQELVVFSIENRILDDQWTSVSDAVVRMLGQIRGVSFDGFARADVSFGMTSKRQLSKGTFGSETNLMTQRILATT